MRLTLSGIFKCSAARPILAKILRNFTDKQPFFSDLSVKPSSKRLNFYGQTVIFAYFVRNRHFSSRSFTDRRPIFIDVSVNVSDFAKCSA
ncbi:hypothetical protein SAMN02910432_01433 [Ligilactobacillus ruminis DSM 20403 = NBRC 102161]|uniref:Uncharacterized protein n=1 Tax=Ligilactobacillus ruminis DSM 20403 = NBRC 102161 TaxID=1423798 RepID=A0A1I2S537_9LACO|nr:hypothetical protein SAMN02910432_01433 [Ligilactobacillus ruminis DSM 20403 = NBRC 102161]